MSSRPIDHEFDDDFGMDGDGPYACPLPPLDVMPLGTMPRRSFLTRLTGAIYLSVCAVLFTPTLGMLTAPLRWNERKRWVPVLDESGLRDGETRSVDYRLNVEDGYMNAERTYSVYLHRQGKAVIAFDPTCPHLGCRVAYKPQKHRYVCPCHGGTFTEDGEVVAGPPPHGLTVIRTKLEDGYIWIYKVS